MITSNQQYFKIADLFDIIKGKRLIKENMISGIIPFIGAISINNGVRDYIDDGCINESNCITVNYNGSVGESFYQNESFIASDDVNILYPKAWWKLNKNIALYICTVLKHNRSRFGYGRKWKTERMLETSLLLPAKDNMPDWGYMEDYVETIAKKIRFKPIKTKIVRNNKPLKTAEWKECELLSLFKMSAGKYYPVTEYDEGEISLISASENNNGVMMQTDLSPEYPGNCLTIGKVGMSVYYQQNPFCASPDVTVLEPLFNEFDRYIAMFLIGLLSKQKHQWNYGNQIRLNDSQKLKILLPVNKKTLEPDWNFMRNYVKILPFAEYL